MSKALAQIQEVIELIEWRQENGKEVNMPLLQARMVKALVMAIEGSNNESRLNTAEIIIAFKRLTALELRLEQLEILIKQGLAQMWQCSAPNKEVL